MSCLDCPAYPNCPLSDTDDCGLPVPPPKEEIRRMTKEMFGPVIVMSDKATGLPYACHIDDFMNNAEPNWVRVYGDN